jgi:hypothetical protein
MHPEQFVPLLPLVFLLLIAIVIKSFLRARGAADFPYERIEKLFTAAERSLLGVLEQILGSEYRVLGKIRLSDIIQPKKGLSNSAKTTALNRITSKHVDFAICDPRTLQVVGVIELDDASHSGLQRQRADNFVDGALAAAGVPIVRIPAQRGYSPAEIREQVPVLLRR